ncbi:DNA methyltransferase [Salinibacterium sp.]|uniref:DNA-methyltransferase n=1 Tax=Salinibacterium sp. TaxID=1915057 RepID=UPI00286D134E|nr:DNA methyltransferase [Salinibacterium sp.]
MPREMVSTTPEAADGQTVPDQTVPGPSVPGPSVTGPNRVIHGDNLAVIATLPDESFRLIYLDPPFNTGRTQQRQNIRTVRNSDGARKGFQGQSYETVKGTLTQYDDRFADYWGFLEPRLIEAWRLLDDRGTLYLHLDYREAHYAKVALDALFGRDSFLNEIIWAYDYGARATKKWPSKHDTILVYVKNPRTYYFDNLAVDREPYMAPGLVTPEKVERGKLPTDVWWHTIVSPNGREKTGYATQKPEGIVRRIIQASSAPGDWVLDFFAGSGTTGAVAQALDRRFLLVDENPDAIAIMRARLGETAVFSRHAEAAVFSRHSDAAPSPSAPPAQTPSPGTMTP